jgi:hypothetical protein
LLHLRPKRRIDKQAQQIQGGENIQKSDEPARPDKNHARKESERQKDTQRRPGKLDLITPRGSYNAAHRDKHVQRERYARQLTIKQQVENEAEPHGRASRQ